MLMRILDQLLEKKRRNLKSLYVLLDPDKTKSDQRLLSILTICQENAIDQLMVGGSLIHGSTGLHELVTFIKDHSPLQVILFPGSNMHIEARADGILFLSLLSGRNPEFLIGQQVVAAPLIRKSKLEVIPTGYLLVDPGHATTVSYISNTTPIPRNNSPIASCTAMAAEMFGFRQVYLDAGSGAANPVPPEMIAEVADSIEIPLLVGGGINTVAKAERAFEAGADALVIGNGIENNLNLLIEVSEIINDYNRSTLN